MCNTSDHSRGTTQCCIVWNVVVDADVSKLVPATIKAVLVELLLHQLHKDFLLEGHLVYNFILNLLCGFLDRCWLCLQLLMVHERDWSFS